MKRACPYDANLLRSSKQHFMNHDLDVTARARVYEETLKKLRNGVHIASNCINSPATEPRQAENKSRVSKQMLLSSYFQGNGIQATETIKPMIQITSDFLPCSYCDKREETCQCSHCGEFFCSSCCLTSYSSSEEIVICLSCS